MNSRKTLQELFVGGRESVVSLIGAGGWTISCMNAPVSFYPVPSPLHRISMRSSLNIGVKLSDLDLREYHHQLKKTKSSENSTVAGDEEITDWEVEYASSKSTEWNFLKNPERSKCMAHSIV